MKKTLLLNLFLAMFFGAQTAQASVVLNATNFPDATFRTYISELTGVSIGGTISDAKLANVERIAVKEMGISSLKGIEYFTEITYLWCQENRLTSLDVSKNTKLTYLQCNNNQITSLDVSKNTELIDLFCYGNLITSLDVSKNTKLEVLNCDSNQLTSLDVSKNTELSYLNCALNQLTSLDVSKNTKLVELNCCNNQLTSLDVSKNTLLKELRCQENKISYLYLSKNTELEVLSCYSNKIDQLNLSNNTKLRALYCKNNYLTNLNLDNNAALTNSDIVNVGNQSSTRRFTLNSYGSNTNNCWTLYVGTTDASRIRNLKIDGESKTPVTNASGWLVVSDDLKKIPQKIEYEIYTGNTTAGWMSVTVNYDVKKYGVYVDGKELTSLNFYDIPGLKEGTAYFYDESSGLGWDGTQPTLVLSDAKIEGEDGIRNEDCYNLNIIVRGDNEVTATDFNAFSSNSVAVKTTFSGGGTLRFTATSDTWNGIYAIDSYIIIKDATKIIARGNGYGYFDDGSILYIQENAILACYGDVYSVEPPSEKNRKFDTNIGIRYPAGAFFSGYHVYYAGTSTDVQKDWVVIGPDNQATQNVIADGIASPKSSPEGTDLIYNMAGQCVGNGYKGIVIKDGRKTLRK
ncbi:MAG: leucine-rich repeat domain-containing protein [Bacteroidaceae bacterium]|nr:leucine-rich repeat domain-containing protein [Bacteroidaceae bacterium]